MRLLAKPERARLLVVLAAVAMLVAVGLAYASAPSAKMIWDDHQLVQGDRRWKQAPAVDLFTEPFWPESPLDDARAAYFRPLVLLSFRLDLALGGGAAQFDLTNVLLHLAACALLAYVVRRLGATGGAAVVAALVWGLAPRLTESVAWISGRTDVIAALFGLGALALSPDAGAGAAARGPVAYGRAVLAAIALFAALAGKEVAIAFVAAAALGAWLPRDGEPPRSRERVGRGLVTAGAPLVAYAALRLHALSGTTTHHRALGAGARAATVLEAVGRYAEMVVDPLHPRTSIGMLGEVSAAYATLGGLLVAGALVAALRFGRRAPYGVKVAAALAIVAIAPVLHVVPIGTRGAVAADRFLYVPLAGLVAAIAVAAGALSPSGRRTFASAALMLALASAVFARARVGDYTDEARFWVVAAERAHPHNTGPRSSLAALVRDDGRPALACRLFDAVIAVQRVSPGTTREAAGRARENLAGCLARIGRYGEARAVYDDLARDEPGSGRVLMGLGFVKMHVFDFDGARRAFEGALRLEPSLAPYVRPALSGLDVARAAHDAFASESARREHPLEYADYLASIGRGPDAERAFLAIAEDPAMPPSARADAALFVARNGSVEAARRACKAALAPGDPSATAARHLLARRAKRQAAIDRLLPRIERLASPP